jgi:hypothetical protein
MKLRFRPYKSDNDYWRMREFLREVFVLNDRHEWSWHVARLDYARWHTCLNCAHVSLQDVAFIWEQQDQGRIVAILMPDGGYGEAHFLVHPILRTPGLEEEMLNVAEERLAVAKPEGGPKLYVWVPEQDRALPDLLTGRGYAHTNSGEFQWRRSLAHPFMTHSSDLATRIAPSGMALSYSSAAMPQGSVSTRETSGARWTTATTQPGTATSRWHHSTAATSTWWLSPRTAR